MIHAFIKRAVSEWIRSAMIISQAEQGVGNVDDVSVMSAPANKSLLKRPGSGTTILPARRQMTFAWRSAPIARMRRLRK